MSRERPLRILVVEDDLPVRETVKAMLTGLGHAVVTAADGAEGIERVKDADPDLVITDIVMPDKEGIETIIEIRRFRPDIKVIAMSGGGRSRNMDFLRFAERLGADATLAKPFGLDALGSVIERVVSSRSDR